MSGRTILLALIAGTVFFLNLGGPRLWDEDEPRNAGCAVEMMERSDWVVPYFNGEVRTHKPVFLYWLMMLAYQVFGVSEFSARFWSALFGLLTVLLTWFIGKRLFSDRIGLIAGGILASTMMFTVASRAATPDATLIFFMTAAIAVYVASTPAFRQASERGVDEPAPLFPTHGPAIVGIYALLGVATLVKGPVGFLLPTAIIGMFLLVSGPCERASTDRAAPLVGVRGRIMAVLRWFAVHFHPRHFFRCTWQMRPLWLAGVVLVIALPWYLWVTIRSDGVWTRGFFLDHNLGRAVSRMENHGGTPLYYPLALMVGFFPWSIFFIPWAIDLVRSWQRQSPHDNALRFTVCWIGVVIGLFTLASTKLPSYVTPCYPALAILMARFVDRLLGERVQVARFWPLVSFAVMAVVGIAVLVAIVFVASDYVEGTPALAPIGGVLIVGAIGCAAFRIADQNRRMIQTMFATATAFVLLLFSWGAGQVSRHQRITELATLIQQRGNDVEIASCGMHRSSWVFYAGQPIEQLPAADRESLEAFLTEGPDRLVLISASDLAAFGHELPSRTSVVGSVPMFLDRGELLLIGRAEERRIAAGDGDRH